MKASHESDGGAGGESQYLRDFSAWRIWISQSQADLDEAARSAAAHAAVLARKLGAADSADAVRSAKSVMALSATQRARVAEVDPSAPGAALNALKPLLSAGWRPDLGSGYQVQLSAGEQLHAAAPCTAYYWGKRRVSTWTAFGLSPIGLVLALITIPIAIARRAEATKDAWRAMSNSSGKVLVTSQRMLRIGSDNKISSNPHSDLRLVGGHGSEQGVAIQLNDNLFLYRIPEPMLTYELLAALQPAATQAQSAGMATASTTQTT
jgi:hypothetical protein